MLSLSDNPDDDTDRAKDRALFHTVHGGDKGQGRGDGLVDKAPSRTVARRGMATAHPGRVGAHDPMKYADAQRIVVDPRTGQRRRGPPGVMPSPAIPAVHMATDPRFRDVDAHYRGIRGNSVPAQPATPGLTIPGIPPSVPTSARPSNKKHHSHHMALGIATYVLLQDVFWGGFRDIQPL